MFSVPTVRVPRSPIDVFPVTMAPKVAVAFTALGTEEGVQLADVSQRLFELPSQDWLNTWPAEIPSSNAAAKQP